MSPSNSEMDGDQFLKMFLDCHDSKLAELSPTTQNPACNDLTSIVLPPNSRTNMDSYIKQCNSADDLPTFCNLLQSLAMESGLDFATSFPNAGLCIDILCKRRPVDTCDSNCNDHLYSKSCVSETLNICGCEAGEYFNDDGKCVPQVQCGCRDLTDPNKWIAPNAVFMHGCRECVCSGSTLNCDNNCEEVICANSQVPKSKLLATSVDPSCARMICPKPFYANSECMNIATSSQLCFCPEGFKQTQNGGCVQYCPCYQGEKYYNHGERLEYNCQTKICQDGVFVFESERPSDCTGTCVITGSAMKIKPFDTTTLSDFSINGRCEMFLCKIGSDTSIQVKAMECGSSNKYCMNMITIKTPDLKDDIILKSTNPGTVMVGNKEYNHNLGPNIMLMTTNYWLTLIFLRQGFSVRWNGGLTCGVEVTNKAFNDTSGLCGKFNLDATDDREGSDGLPKETTSKLAKSWIVNPEECTMEDDQVVSTNCEGSNHQTWARKACSPILESEAFAACRKHGGEVSFYDNCVLQACNCDTGGDCECLCDAIAAYAAYCNEMGSPAKWRHQRLCPMQCEYGSVYQACGSSCPESCGKSSNATSDLCSSLTCVEGCFCPEGYVRSNLESMEDSECIPKSDCPCVDAKGREIFKGQVVTINCQECECRDGELECTGETCKTECNEDQYLCNDGRCIAIQLKCNGQYDCKDGGDEQSCEGEICEGFLCRIGQCVGNTTVCDQKMDCVDNSDEEKCDIECTEEEYKCSKSMYCIPREFLCDKQIDCWYGEDEADCTVCPQNETHCNISHCIPKNFTCDGNDDCGDGSDEIGCTVPTTTTPEECQHTLKTFTQAENGLSTKTTSGFGNNVFSNGGWTPDSGYGDIQIRIASSVDAVLVEIFFTVKGGKGSTVTLTLTLEDGYSLVEQRKITEDPYQYNGVYNSKFSVIQLTTNATISDMILDICYGPVEVTCSEGSTELTAAYFGLPQGVDSVFRPTSEPSHIAVDVKVKSNQVEDIRITNVLQKVYGVLKVFIEILYNNGRTISDEVNLQGSIFKYEPVDQTDIESIKFLFDVDEKVNSKATVEYLSTEGCIKVKKCTLGYCNGECLNNYSDLCSSPCPPRDCCCSDLIEMTEADLSSLPISFQTYPSVNGGIFDFVVLNNAGKVIITVYVPLGCTLSIMEMKGSYEKYQVTEIDKNEKETIKKNTEGLDVFTVESIPRNVFNADIKEGSEVVITIWGSEEGFTVNITEFRVCLPEENFCRVEFENIFAENKFLTLQNTLGVSSVEGSIVQYGDAIQEGITVIGSCYECTCLHYKLVCKLTSDCNICPNYTTECKGDCNDAVTVVTYDKPGVPDHCQVNSSQPCLPEQCTTPHDCPTPWTSWSSCSNCEQIRTRTCSPECGDVCKDYVLAETQECPSCTTTPRTKYLCGENEVYKCMTKQEKCSESCAVFRKNSSCTVQDDTPCEDQCQCEEGYKRNVLGECVPIEECECYEGVSMSTPIPQSFKVNVSKCVYCECKPTGYECNERKDCCELTEWEEWSPCSHTCGDGVMSRKRDPYGGACPSDVSLIEVQACNVGECPCEYEGQVWESGKTVRDRCGEITCKNGEISSTVFPNMGDPTWPNEQCTERCYCNPNGHEECVKIPELEQCAKVKANCNNETHTLKETDDPCCPECVPIMKPCSYAVQDSVELKVNVTGHGLCVSDTLDVGVSSPNISQLTVYMKTWRMIYLRRLDSGLMSNSTILCADQLPSRKEKLYPDFISPQSFSEAADNRQNLNAHTPEFVPSGTNKPRRNTRHRRNFKSQHLNVSF